MKILFWGLAIPPEDHNPQEAADTAGARGALADEAVSSIIDDNERVRAAFVSPEGLTRVSGDEERHVSVTVAMAVTDRRILFASADVAAGEVGTDAGSLAYDDLAAIGIDGPVLALSMANGVRWEFPLPDADPDVVDSVVRHLRWVGDVRTRLVACRNDVELAAGEIRSHADAMEWEPAERTYDDARDSLDALIGAVHRTEPIDDEVLAPELTEIERTLERAYTRLFIERAESQLELGRHLVENGDYEQAEPVLQIAQSHYERASHRAEAVRRPDRFRFGEERELRDDLDRLSWEIETVAAEPIRQAHEAKIRGLNADSRAEAVDHWETAYRRYGDVLALKLGPENRQFTGDPEKVREELQAAGRRLVDCHRALASRTWREGMDAEDDDVKEALRSYAAAQDHVDRAAELADECQPAAVYELADQCRRMAATIEEIRETETVEMPAEAAETATEPAPEEEATGAPASLAALDTHHEISLDTSIVGQAADGGRQHDRFGAETGNEDSDTPEREAIVGPVEAPDERERDDDVSDDGDS